jgi:hypothetical protein
LSALATSFQIWTWPVDPLPEGCLGMVSFTFNFYSTINYPIFSKILSLF